jgi:hypothetical protein
VPNDRVLLHDDDHVLDLVDTGRHDVRAGRFAADLLDAGRAREHRRPVQRPVKPVTGHFTKVANRAASRLGQGWKSSGSR